MRVQPTEPGEMVLAMNSTKDGSQSTAVTLGHSPTNPGVMTVMYQVDGQTIQAWRYVGQWSDIVFKQNNNVITLEAGGKTVTMFKTSEPVGNYLRISTSKMLIIQDLTLVVL
jgi:hypothetical protein